VIRTRKAEFPVGLMCRSLGLSRSGYYAWEGRSPSVRAVSDDMLTVQIRAVHRSSRGTYGSPRVHAELRDRGVPAGRGRVARLMRAGGIRAQVKRRYRATTDSDPALIPAPNLLARRFDASAADRAWVADLTCLWTAEGWLYLAVILDLYSRRVVGWSMAGHMRQELALGALEMACKQRRPAPGLLHHSDRGSQYAGAAYRSALSEAGMVCSMSRRGDCWDNAVAESFFGTLASELERRSSWATRDAARAALHDYIEVFYNRRRRHSTLGYETPADYEAMAQINGRVAS
jgi:transposase InsO family protein